VEFFSRKLFKFFALGVVSLFFAGVFITAVLFSNVKKVSFSVGFYYLVSDEGYTEASTHLIQLSGGAGYVLTHEGKDYSVLSVYLNEEDGIAVQTALKKDGKSTSLLYKGVQYLHFKGRKEKRNADMYQSALRTLYGYISLLSQTIRRLEEGMTQESCKRVLAPVERQFGYMQKRYQNIYPSFSKVCFDAGKALSALTNKTLYVKDLRYYLCGLSEKYLTLAEEFSL